MRTLLDSSVLVAGLVPAEAGHDDSLRQMSEAERVVFVHALNEVFATLTGGGLGFRVDASLAAKLIHERIVQRMEVVVLDEAETSTALAAARSHGVRGGAVYDYMHLIAARKAGVEAIVTLNVSDFQHLVRTGDPRIELP
jgi:predicted nucleic acid-binding protein